MKQNSIVVFIFALMLSSYTAFSQNVTLKAEPLSKVVNTALRPSKGGPMKVSTITWGADIATYHGVKEGIFKNNGLDISLVHSDDFAGQVQKCINGDIQALRGTMGMINAATDAFAAAGTELVTVSILTWSVGGDCMSARPGKTIDNIKTLGLQLYGPHMDYASNIFTKAKRLNEIEFMWYKNLTLSPKEGSNPTDPITGFQEISKMDATMCIIPDALMLTSNGTVGTGSDNSVKGCKKIISTLTASRVIADVYAFRKDYYDANRAKIEKFVVATLQSQESLEALIAAKSSNQAKVMQLMSECANTFGLLPADTEALLLDCEFVGFNGNVTFFTGETPEGKSNSRNFTTLTNEIQTSFIPMNLMTKKIPLRQANWDYNKISASGKLKNVKTVAAKPKFDQAKVQKSIEQKILAEATTWETDGTLFTQEFYFDANQSDFELAQCVEDFKVAVDIAQTNKGALIIIEGHSDPLGIMQAKLDLRKNKPGHKSQAEINQMKQAAQTKSVERSQTILKLFLKYCNDANIDIDESQFSPIGLGVKLPKYSPPRTEAEWKANRRVVFRIKEVEAELDSFSPLN